MCVFYLSREVLCCLSREGLICVCYLSREVLQCVGLFIERCQSVGVALSEEVFKCECGNTLQHTATHCNTLQHTATHCNTLQHTATHCNTLQHTATTHCNTLQVWAWLSIGMCQSVSVVLSSEVLKCECGPLRIDVSVWAWHSLKKYSLLQVECHFFILESQSII